MLSWIENRITQIIEESPGAERYRLPVVGATAADHPGFTRLAELIPGHLTPEELLPGAQSVIAFFLPFSIEIVKSNRQGAIASREWAQAYVETNQLISDICRKLQQDLGDRGIKAAFARPTHNFDQDTLLSRWSHKHVAYLCGLGTFGLHHMLITPRGCAGRLGSLVLDHPLPASPVPPQEYCLYKREGKCGACRQLCPTEALNARTMDRQRCYKHLLEVSEHYRDLGLCDVCGKCATGPCALGLPGATAATCSRGS